MQFTKKRLHGEKRKGPESRIVMFTLGVRRLKEAVKKCPEQLEEN